MRPRPGSERGRGQASEKLQSLDEDKYLAFRVGDRRYLLEILRVKEVVRMQKLTAMPNAPRDIAGVIDLRGSYVPIIDMRRQTGVPAGPPDAEARIIVTVLQGRLAGLLVDSLLPVMRVAASTMKQPPRMARELGYDFITAMCTRDGEVYMLMNSDRLIARLEEGVRGVHAQGTGAEADARGSQPDPG